MGTTTVKRPTSETQFHRGQAVHRRQRGFPGDESWARMCEEKAHNIRNKRDKGSSTKFGICSRCRDRGHLYALLENDEGKKWCGTCGYEQEKTEG